ncbi:MAG: 4-(cytidine 5'-diphospho)-2-C-methyl-D-erythritol kinase [Deltaproteobacteria bacterium]|nr:4-(cytidine 5'-diphospho)-2-C-methyl-D-erythritol kinase [Deltaproteobacteria bacterium]
MITALSPAKVNLYLRVLRKRPDGYHDILTLMQRISLSDEMLFSPHHQDVVIQCPDGNLPENEENIVYRAARLILTQAGCRQGIQITIKKSIPLAAGLGGGSSNAATALMTINEMLDLGCSPDDLMAMGSKLGADVPFFVLKKTAWATGIGTQLTYAENIPPLWFVLINPGFPVSTKMVYENLNLRLTKEPINYSIPRLSDVPELLSGLNNDLERVTLNFYPVLRQIKKLLIDHGASGSLMSGSGPTVFGIFEEEETAITAQKAIMAMGKWSVYRSFSI